MIPLHHKLVDLLVHAEYWKTDKNANELAAAIIKLLQEEKII